MEIRWGWITNVIRSFWKLSKHTLYDAWIVLCKKCFVFNIIVNLWLYTTSIAFWGKELQQIERNLPYITIWIHGCPSKSRYFGPWNVLEVKWPSAVAKHGNLVVVWVAFKATFKKRKLGTHTLVYWPTWKVTSKRAEEAILPHLWGEKEVLKLKRMHYGFGGCTMGSEDVLWAPRMYYTSQRKHERRWARPIEIGRAYALPHTPAMESVRLAPKSFVDARAINRMVLVSKYYWLVHSLQGILNGGLAINAFGQKILRPIPESQLNWVSLSPPRDPCCLASVQTCLEIS